MRHLFHADIVKYTLELLAYDIMSRYDELVWGDLGLWESERSAHNDWMGRSRKDGSSIQSST